MVSSFEFSSSKFRRKITAICDVVLVCFSVKELRLLTCLTNIKLCD